MGANRAVTVTRQTGGVIESIFMQPIHPEVQATFDKHFQVRHGQECNTCVFLFNHMLVLCSHTGQIQHTSMPPPPTSHTHSTQQFPPTEEEIQSAAVGASTNDLSHTYGPDHPTTPHHARHINGAASWTREQVKTKHAAWEARHQRRDMVEIQQGRTQLPIYQYREEIVRAVRDHQVVLVAGETGCGKTTQVCVGGCISLLCVYHGCQVLAGCWSIPSHTRHLNNIKHPQKTTAPPLKTPTINLKHPPLYKNTPLFLQKHPPLFTKTPPFYNKISTGPPIHIGGLLVPWHPLSHHVHPAPPHQRHHSQRACGG